MARLEVDIDANIQGLQNSIDQAVKVATKLGNPFEKTTGVINTLNQRISILKKNLESATDVRSIAQYNRRLQDTQNELQRVKGLGTQALTAFGNAAQRTSVQVNQLSRSTSSYNGIGIEFSRIIQDAPFGIVGIGNNIQQLAATFQQLRATSTSTGAALKTALASIIQPANLLVLGISVLTSALTYLSMKGFFKSKESAEDAADALEKYRESLEAVRRASVEGASQAQSEIQSFKLLRAQAENANIPLETRIEAVKELKEEYPEYLGDLTEEQILTGKVGTAYENLTKQLIATAKARAASDRIAENSLKILTLEEKLQDNLREQERLKAIDSQKAVAISGTGATVITEQDVAQKKLNERQAEQVAILEEILPLKEEDARLTNYINENISQGAKFTKEQKDEVDKLSKAFEEFSKGYEKLNEKLSTQESFLELEIKNAEKLKKIGEEITATYDRLGAAIVKGGQLGSFEELDVSLPSTAPQQDVADVNPLDIWQTRFDELKEQFEAFSGDFIGSVLMFTQNVQAIVQDNLGQAFVGIGEAIGQSLAAGESVISAIGKSLLDSIAAFLGDLGQQLIAFGIAGIAFGALMEAISKGGPLAIPAGIAAIAAGVALVAISSAIRSSAAKGVGGGGSGGGGNVSTGGAGSSFSGSGIEPYGYNDINLTSTIKGSDIVLSVERTQNKENNG